MSRSDELTPHQREVVERVRANMRAAVDRAHAAMRGPNWHPEVPAHREPNRGELAARACRAEDISYREASARFGVSIGIIGYHWKRLYPGEPRKRGPRKGAPRHPYDPQTPLPPSRSVLAARWAKEHNQPLTAAAREFQITRQAVSLGWRKEYPDEARKRGRRSG